MHSFRVEATGVSGLAPITGTFWQYDVEAVESSRFLFLFFSPGDRFGKQVGTSAAQKCKK